MKTKRILAYIDIMVDLIDKDTINYFHSGPDSWNTPFIKTKAQKRVHRIKSDYAHALLIKTARKVLDEY